MFHIWIYDHVYVCTIVRVCMFRLPRSNHQGYLPAARCLVLERPSVSEIKSIAHVTESVYASHVSHRQVVTFTFAWFLAHSTPFFLGGAALMYAYHSNVSIL
jgi:hypothetical protein